MSITVHNRSLPGPLLHLNPGSAFPRCYPLSTLLPTLQTSSIQFTYVAIQYSSKQPANPPACPTPDTTHNTAAKSSARVLRPTHRSSYYLRGCHQGSRRRRAVAETRSMSLGRCVSGNVHTYLPTIVSICITQEGLGLFRKHKGCFTLRTYSIVRIHTFY